MYDHDVATREGYIPVNDGWIWYHIVGTDRTATPLVVLHGGPGSGYAYLQPLSAVASDRMVVFYDQLGCGRSETPNDPTLWHIERFVEELDAVRQLLGLQRIHLFGHSWGGWLALEYMLTHSAGVESLILASTSASLPEYAQEIERLKQHLPEETYRTMMEHERTGDLEHPEYKGAALEFYQRHLCRLDPWPQRIVDNVRNLNGNAVYNTLQGPNEFTIIGNLKDWDRTNRLHDITVPTLITVGRYDEATPVCAETLRRGIRDAHLHVFEHSAHMAHIEEQERYQAVLVEFLRTVEQQTRASSCNTVIK